MYGIGYDKSASKAKRSGAGFKSLILDKNFPKLQENFEHKLGMYAYKNPKAIRAVDIGLLKMRKVLYKYYSDKFKDIEDEAKREQKICLEAFTNDKDPSSEGQIGNASYAQLCEVIGGGLKGKNIIIDKMIEQNAKQNGGKYQGNLREKYTAFYNAAYFKSVYDSRSGSNDKVVNFKNIMQEIAVNNRTELVDELGLDESALEAQNFTSTKITKAGFLRSIYNSGIINKIMGYKAKVAAEKVKKYEEKKNNYRGARDSFLSKYYDKQIQKNKDKEFSANNFNKRFHARDVYDLTLISLEPNKLEVALDYLKNGKSFRFRNEEEQKELERDLSYYNDLGLNLSDREAEFILKTLAGKYVEKNEESDKDLDERRKELMLRAYNASVKHQLYKSFDPTPALSILTEEERKIVEERVAKTKSPIKEGFIGKEVKEDSKFLKKFMQNEKGVRIVNGFSGTTSRMLKTYKWLGLGSNFMNFRLGLMGWMLPTDDHSLWEIIIGSHNVGVKGKEDLTDIISLDQTVDPLDEGEIRKNVCQEYSNLGKMFPHEIVYWKQRYESEDDDQQQIAKTGTNKTEIFSKSGAILNNSFEIEETNKLKSLISQCNKLEEELAGIQKELSLINVKKQNILVPLIPQEVQDILDCLDKLSYFLKNFTKSDKYLADPVPANLVDALKKMEKFCKQVNSFGDINEIISGTDVMIKFFSSLKDYEHTGGVYNKLKKYVEMIEAKLSAEKDTLIASIVLTEEQENSLESLDKEEWELNGAQEKKKFQFENVGEKVVEELIKEKNRYSVQKAAILSYTGNFSGLLTNVSKLDNTKDPIKRAFIQRLINKELIKEGIFTKETIRNKDAREKIVERLSAQNYIISDAIRKADKKYISGPPLYSGQWTVNLNEKGKVGKIITWDAPTSASKSPDVARTFSKRPVAGFTNFALYEITATGKNGLDLTQGGKGEAGDLMNLSVYGSEEQEVLFRSGTRLKITDVQRNINISHYNRGADFEDSIAYYRYKLSKEKDENGEPILEKLGDKIGTLIKCKEV